MERFEFIEKVERLSFYFGDEPEDCHDTLLVLVGGFCATNLLESTLEEVYNFLEKQNYKESIYKWIDSTLECYKWCDK